MSLAIFFGGCAIVILIGIGTVIHGYRYHYLEDQKKKAEQAGK
ncbi:hypothetical protein [Bdellovibrio sp. HCB337]